MPEPPQRHVAPHDPGAGRAGAGTGAPLLRPAPPVTWRDRVEAARTFVRERPGQLGGALAALVGAVLIGVVLLRPPGAAPSAAPELDLPRADGGPAAASPDATTPTELVVHVLGGVVRPGLVRLPPGTRVADAVAAAGGLHAEADVERLNLAAPLSDGQRLYVPLMGREPPLEVAVSSGGPAPGAATVVDLNRATLEELESLPGVGPATAQAILDHRRRMGRFRSVDDLLEVRGIGEAKLAALRPRVRV